MDYLISHGASITTNDPQKILLFIHPYNYSEAADTIVQLGIFKDVMKFIGAELLHYAAGHGDILMVHALLASGVNVNARNDLESTALHEAAKGGHSEVAEILILCGAAVNARNNLGLTALHYAIEHKHWEVAKILGLHRANFSLQDKCGETVIDLAERKNKSKHLDAIEKIIQANCPTTASHSPYRWGYTNVNRGRVTSLADNFTHMQLEPRIEACPGPSTKMNGIKEQRADSKKRKLHTESDDSNSSIETDECNNRWSYGKSSKAIAIPKYSSFNR